MLSRQNNTGWGVFIFLQATCLRSSTLSSIPTVCTMRNSRIPSAGYSLHMQDDTELLYDSHTTGLYAWDAGEDAHSSSFGKLMVVYLHFAYLLPTLPDTVLPQRLCGQYSLGTCNLLSEEAFIWYTKPSPNNGYVWDASLSLTVQHAFINRLPSGMFIFQLGQ